MLSTINQVVKDVISETGIKGIYSYVLETEDPNKFKLILSSWTNNLFDTLKDQRSSFKVNNGFETQIKN